jgi:hypothetical protein
MVSLLGLPDVVSCLEVRLGLNVGAAVLELDLLNIRPSPLYFCQLSAKGLFVGSLVPRLWQFVL